MGTMLKVVQKLYLCYALSQQKNKTLRVSSADLKLAEESFFEILISSLTNESGEWLLPVNNSDSDYI